MMVVAMMIGIHNNVGCDNVGCIMGLLLFS